MNARQAVVLEPFKVGVREVELPASRGQPDPGRTARSAPSAPAPNWPSTPAPTSGSRTRTCPTGSSRSAPATAPPAPSSPSAPTSPAGKPGDRVSYPGNHASHELLTIGHERGRLWKLPDEPRLREGGGGLHRPLRPGRVDPGRPDAGPVGRGAGAGHHRPVRPALPAGGRCLPGRRHRRREDAARCRRCGRRRLTSSTPRAGDVREQLQRVPRPARRGDRRRRDRRAGRDPDRDGAGLRRRAGGRRRQPARQGEGRQLLRRPAPPLHRGDRGPRQHAVRAGPHPAGRRLGHRQGPELAAGRAGLRPAQPGRAGHAHASRRTASARPTRGC